MPLFVDYCYAGPDPAPKAWRDLQSLVNRTFPVAAAGVAAKSPPKEDVHALAMSDKDFFWHAATMGYGDQASYVVRWLLKGEPLDAANIEELKRITRARVTTLARAYQFKTDAKGHLVMLPRDIYPLIETTEKVAISYLMGCAMASICGPQAISHRTTPSSSAIPYLLHAKLLKAHATISNALLVHTSNAREVDFVGFDNNFDVHIFEAKGDGDGFSYVDLADGLDQCSAVTGVEFTGLASGTLVKPKSINTCFGFLSSVSVTSNLGPVEKSVRCAVFERLTAPSKTSNPASSVVPSAEKEAIVVKAGRAFRQLSGLRALGLYSHLQTAKPRESVDAWSTFQFDEGFSEHSSLTVTVPTDLINRASELIRLFPEHFNRLKFAQRLNRELKRPSANSETTSKAEFLTIELEKLGEYAKKWQSIEPPQGYHRAVGDPWVCISMQPTN